MKNTRINTLVRTAVGSTLTKAREVCYSAVRRIRFPGAQYRTDIAAAGVGRISGVASV